MRKAATTLAATIFSLAWGGASHAQDYIAELKAPKFLGPGGCRPANAADAALFATIASGKMTATGYVDACNQHVVPRILSINVGGSLGEITAVFSPDPSGSCWGQAGADLTLLDSRDRPIWNSSVDGVAVLPSTHFGVHDLSFGGPGFQAPVWIWNPQIHQYKFLAFFNMGG